MLCCSPIVPGQEIIEINVVHLMQYGYREPIVLHIFEANAQAVEG